MALVFCRHYGKKQPVHEYLYWDYPDDSEVRAIRMGKWKGLVLNTKGKETFVLFDLEKDPREQTDVSADHPYSVEKMQHRIRQIGEEA